ncbi:MAG: hypothetical protein IT371_13325 [Deltaproteobacteria bacterium]|nr:hypothetical protein [Deltaproteobacteria bacterium]
MLDEVLSVAFHRGPAAAANQLIADVRETVEAACGRAVNYEVVATDRGWPYLAEQVAPRLALFLRSKRLRVSSCRPVFMSLFVGDSLYFIGAPDFFRLVQQSMGLTDAAFGAVTQVWEETGQPVPGRLLLGGGA